MAIDLQIIDTSKDIRLPLLIDTMRKNPKLHLPSILIGVASVISIIFATGSIRRQHMIRVTDSSLIEGRKTNLFIFGNFYDVDFVEKSRTTLSQTVCSFYEKHLVANLLTAVFATGYLL